MLTNTIASSIAAAMKNRESVSAAASEMTELLTSTRVQQKITLPGIPAINFPEALIKRTALRTRIYEGLFSQRPFAKFINIKGKDETGIDWYAVAREASDFFDYEARHGLNLLPVMRRCITEFVDYGTCVWKVHISTPHATDSFSPEDQQRPMWSFVSITDLLFPSGYGPDVGRLPWIGQVVTYTEAEIYERFATGTWYYDPEGRFAVPQPAATEEENSGVVVGETEATAIKFDAISTAWIELQRDTEYEDTTWPVAEIWYYDESGIERLADIHLPSGTVLRDVRAPHRRPYFKATLDEKTAMSFLGMGAIEKLRSLQDVNNGLVNAILTTAIASNSQVRLIRSGSNLATILYGGDRVEQIGVNFQAVTENPEADLRVVALADPSGATVAADLLGLIKNYGDELFGTGPAQMGNVSVARRAPATGVAAIMAQGGMPVTDALRRLAEEMGRAVMFTLELYENYGPRNMPYIVLGNDGEFVTRAFSVPKAITQSLIVDVAIADPSNDNDSKLQKQLTVFQVMQSWHTMLMQQLTLAANPQAPPALRRAIANLAVKQQEVLGRMLDTIGGIQDVNRFLFDAESEFNAINEETDALATQMQDMMQQMATLQQQQQQQQGAGNGSPA